MVHVEQQNVKQWTSCGLVALDVLFFFLGCCHPTKCTWNHAASLILLVSFLLGFMYSFPTGILMWQSFVLPHQGSSCSPAHNFFFFLPRCMHTNINYSIFLLWRSEWVCFWRPRIYMGGRSECNLNRPLQKNLTVSLLCFVSNWSSSKSLCNSMRTQGDS